MEYDKTYNSYINYIEKCKNIIINSLFTKKDLININFIGNNEEINNVIKKHRLKMIDIKLEHTMRMIEQTIKINNALGLKFDLDLVIKVAVLYHDIGRIRQATWSNTFADTIYKKTNSKFTSHSEEGYDIFLNNDFNIDKKYIPIISQTILYHQNYYTNNKLNYKYNHDLKGIDINKIVTGNFNLNNLEWQVASLIVQLVSDIDKTDILYQHLSNDFGMINDYVYDYSNDTLDNISKKWEVDKKEILEYNKIEEINYKEKTIKIPIENMPIKKLELPEYMKKMFYDNNWPELNILIQDKNWNFISILWWRLSHFLNQISFSSTLINIEESKLLEQIYEKIPEKLKPLVGEAFEYAEEVFVIRRIKENKGNIYLKTK